VKKLLLFILLIPFGTFSQNNAIKVNAIGLYLFVIYFGEADLSYERYINNHSSVSVNYNYLNMFIVSGGLHSHSIRMNYSYYLQTIHFKNIKNWVSPHVGIIFTESSGGENYDYIIKQNFKNAGITLGQRYVCANNKLFFDLGFGLSYGLIHYTHYYENYYYEGITITHKNDEFSYYPRFILNMGFNF